MLGDLGALGPLFASLTSHCLVKLEIEYGVEQIDTKQKRKITRAQTHARPTCLWPAMGNCLRCRDLSLVQTCATRARP